MRFAYSPLILTLILSLAGPSPRAHAADVAVGDKPTLKFNAFPSGTTVDLADLHGKIVVVDFFASWCESWLAQADHLAQLNEKYTGRGFAMIGVSLDADPLELTPVMQSKNIKWPVACDGGGWNGAIAVAWGISSIPQTFIISPDGVVLWRGRPTQQLDAALEDAFHQHPPQLLNAEAIAAVGQTLTSIESAIAGKQPATAVKLLAGISSEAKFDPRVADRVNAATKNLQEYGTAQLAEADTLISQKKYQEASAKLQELDQAFAGMPTADQAKQRLAALQAPDVKAVLDAQQKAKDAADQLANAKRLLATNPNGALAILKDIVKNYPDTPEAKEAASIVAAREGEAKAMGIIERADSLANMNLTDTARKRYQEVIDQYPNTKAAAIAKQKMQQLQ